MAVRGEPVHGEADAVTRLIEKHLASKQRCSILDAGCGTGRLAVELDRRGHRVTAVDLDPDMIDRARSKSTSVQWFVGDLSTTTFDGGREPELHDVIVMAGNILNFCAPGSQADIVRNMVNRLVDGGLLVCGWSQELRDDAYHWNDFVRDAHDGGATVAESWSNWEGDALPSSTLAGEPVHSSDYAVIAVIKKR